MLIITGKGEPALELHALIQTLGENGGAVIGYMENYWQPRDACLIRNVPQLLNQIKAVGGVTARRLYPVAALLSAADSVSAEKTARGEA